MPTGRREMPKIMHNIHPYMRAACMEISDSCMAMHIDTYIMLMHKCMTCVCVYICECIHTRWRICKCIHMPDCTSVLIARWLSICKAITCCLDPSFSAAFSFSSGSFYFCFFRDVRSLCFSFQLCTACAVQMYATLWRTCTRERL